jgi:hypothetical protein
MGIQRHTTEVIGLENWEFRSFKRIIEEELEVSL